MGLQKNVHAHMLGMMCTVEDATNDLAPRLFTPVYSRRLKVKQKNASVTQRYHAIL